MYFFRCCCCCVVFDERTIPSNFEFQSAASVEFDIFSAKILRYAQLTKIMNNINGKRSAFDFEFEESKFFPQYFFSVSLYLQMAIETDTCTHTKTKRTKNWKSLIHMYFRRTGKKILALRSISLSICLNNFWLCVRRSRKHFQTIFVLSCVSNIYYMSSHHWADPSHFNGIFTMPLRCPLPLLVMMIKVDSMHSSRKYWYGAHILSTATD